MTQVAPKKRTSRNTGGEATRTRGTTDATTTEGREPPATEKPAAEKPAAAPSAEPPPEATEAVMGLDMVLVDGARGPLRRLVPPARTSLRFATALAGRPQVIARQTGEYVKELGRIGVGRSEVAPNKKDRRFADPAWTGNPMLRRIMQAHIASAQMAARLVDDAELDWQDDERIRFTMTNVVDALAPSNVPWINPLMWKALI